MERGTLPLVPSETVPFNCYAAGDIIRFPKNSPILMYYSCKLCWSDETIFWSCLARGTNQQRSTCIPFFMTQWCRKEFSSWGPWLKNSILYTVYIRSTRVNVVVSGGVVPPPSRSSPPPRFLHYCDLSNNFSWKYLYSSLSLYNEYPVKYFITLPQLLLHTQPQPVMQVTHVCINHITENPFLCILLG